MSGDATIRYGVASDGCALCDRSLSDDQRVCQCYGDGVATLLDGPVVGLCGHCRGEVAELVDTWATVPEPPVDADSIAAGYGRVADGCSFCERTFDAHPVGVEYYRAGTAHDGGLADVRHYALCPHCVSVFAEFLRGVADE